MASRREKEAAVRKYAGDLAELSEAYSLAARVLGEIDDKTLNAMVMIAVEGNRIHNELADALEIRPAAGAQ
jgi:hypothetical protein